MKYLLSVFFFCSQILYAQKLKKAEKAIFSNLKNHVFFLSSDSLQGRRTGSEGSRKAGEYIAGEFGKAGLASLSQRGDYFQSFEIDDGKEMAPSCRLLINEHELKSGKDYFSLPFSGTGSIEAATAVSLKEKGGPWFLNLNELIQTNKHNPHFDLSDEIKTRALTAQSSAATAFFVYNTSDFTDGLAFESKSKQVPISIPVVYVSKAAALKYLTDESSVLDIDLRIFLANKKRITQNIVGYLDNQVKHTIVIGAHYDHLGMGEDKNSLYTGDLPMIHNGADDNASGVSVMIELIRSIKKAKLKNNNILFIAFSGEELGLFGSKYFTEHPLIDLAGINYMVNLDMVGRLNDSTRGLTIGGVGTSPEWGNLLIQKRNYFNVKADSSGVGPSDHTSFYRKNIPVLFFFTGIHSDYHKPSDDADTINYFGALKILEYVLEIAEKSDKVGKLAFTKTKEAIVSAKSSFKVTLGIMPDYTFSGSGVRADGISEGKAAQRVGMRAGDVIVQVGAHSCVDVQTYMEALSKFSKGDSAKIKVLRNNEVIYFDVIF